MTERLRLDWEIPKQADDMDLLKFLENLATIMREQIKSDGAEVDHGRPTSYEIKETDSWIRFQYFFYPVEK